MDPKILAQDEQGNRRLVELEAIHEVDRDNSLSLLYTASLSISKRGLWSAAFLKQATPLQGEMRLLNKDHPEVVALLQQLQAQRENIGKVPLFVGYANVDHLRTELYQRGWNTRLADDQKTVLLVPRKQ